MERNESAYCNKAFEGEAALHVAALNIMEDKDTIPSTGTSKCTKKQKFVMTKDICFLSFSFFLLFTSYNSVQNLQSSINARLGTISLSVLYASMMLSSAFVPTWLLKNLGVRNGIAICMLGYTSYIAAQFYPVGYTLIPTAIIVGLAASPLWTAESTYISHMGKKYAELTGEDSEVSIARFFGIFFLFHHSNGVVGNLISSTVFAVDANPVNASDPGLESCGIRFRQGSTDSNTPLERTISDEERTIMTGVYLSIAFVAPLVVMIFVSPLGRYGDDERIGSSTGRTSKQQLVATFHHMKHPYQILIAPLSMWSGVEQAFITVDFTAAYVSCGLGVHMIGYTMICFGACDAICSFFSSYVVKMVGRIPVFLTATVINSALIGILLTWMPNPENLTLFFLVPALWGVADAVWLTQTSAFYGVLFPEETEAAFSNYNLFRSLGYIIAFVGSTLLYVDVKLYILIAFLSLGVVGYIVIEYQERNNGQKTSID